jgi:NAD(P)-dependent dehydrogenase (short-subunit alcohol dehydrogenase family)
MPLVTFEADAQEWARQIDVGLGGMFNCTYRLAADEGTGRRPHITASERLERPRLREEIAYRTIKHGVEGSQSLSLEARAHNIALNTIGPGARIKPTRVTWAEHGLAPADPWATWADPLTLGGVGLARRPAARPLQRPSLRRRESRRDHRPGG